MARHVLDKNPDQDVLGIVRGSIYNLVCCTQPFSKQAFLEKMVDKIPMPVIYLDFDLLYSGYARIGIVPRHERLELHQISGNPGPIIVNVARKISRERTLVIVDSLNGLYNMLENENPGRAANAHLMLLATCARQSDSRIAVSCMARKKEDGGLALVPSGRRVLLLDKMRVVFLQ